MIVNLNSNGIKSLWDFLKGKKTYILSLVAVVYGWGIQQGIWHHDARIDYLLVGGSFAAIRHGVSTETDGTTTVVVQNPPGQSTPSVAPMNKV